MALGTGREWSTRVLDLLRIAVAEFAAYDSSDRAASDQLWPVPLALDESRLGEVDEAWVPVVTPDGPGVLVWENSD